MRRKGAVIVAAVVAVAVGLGAFALALSAGGGTTTAPSATASAGAEPFGETDYCYVEAMIYYRAEAVDLTEVLLNTDDVSAEARAIAQDIHDEQADQLAGLREMYLEWKSARPLERTDTGPCAGHADHSGMVGLPSWSQLNRYTAASGTEAEQIFAELMIAQNAGVTAFAQLVLDADPNDQVTDAATAAIAQAAREDETLRPLLP